MAERSEQNNAEKSSDSSAELDSFRKNFPFLDTTTCCHCNGFCGPNFDEPVCGPCHKFLFNSRKRRRELRLEDVVYRPFRRSYAATGDHYGYLELITFPEPSTSRSPRAEIQLKDLHKFFGDIETNKNNETSKESADGDGHINKLPLEMIEKVFSYFDEDTLLVVSKVSKQWERIVDSQQEKWKNLTNKRWPLLDRNTETTNWFKMYEALKTSCCCRLCVNKMIENVENCTRPTVSVRAVRDVQNGFQVNGVRIVALNEQMTYLLASIAGPSDSPYEGGIFYLRIHVPENYPFLPPEIKFLTKIIHPNISRHGDIGMDTITYNYATAMTLIQILLSIQSLLCDPFTKACMEPEVGRLYDNDRRRFDALARDWTKKYAMMNEITFDD